MGSAGGKKFARCGLFEECMGNCLQHALQLARELCKIAGWGLLKECMGNSLRCAFQLAGKLMQISAFKLDARGRSKECQMECTVRARHCMQPARVGRGITKVSLTIEGALINPS